MHQKGRTILFVSHDLGAVARVCSRVVWIDGGRIRMDARHPQEVIKAYVTPSEQAVNEAPVATDPLSPVQAVSVAIMDEQGDTVGHPHRDEPISVRIRLSLPSCLTSMSGFMCSTRMACV